MSFRANERATQSVFTADTLAPIAEESEIEFEPRGRGATPGSTRRHRALCIKAGTQSLADSTSKPRSSTTAARFDNRVYEPNKQRGSPPLGAERALFDLGEQVGMGPSPDTGSECSGSSSPCDDEGETPVATTILYRSRVALRRTFERLEPANPASLIG